MFDLGKLGDLSKVAGQAKQIQEAQAQAQARQAELLQKILQRLDEIVSLLKEKSAV